MFPPNRFNTVGTKAFTLIEFAAAMCIVMVLAVLGTAGYRRALAKAQSVQCTSNLRQIHLAVMQYTQDNDGTLPYAWNNPLSWVNLLVGYQVPDGVSYIPSFPGYPGRSPLLRCPSQGKHTTNPTLSTYCMNGTLCSNPPPKLVNVEKPSKTMLISDGYAQPGGNFQVALFQGAWTPSAAHGDSANIVFVDGHIESRIASEIPLNPWSNSPDWYLWNAR